jgi:hypothetical protein
MKGTNVIAANNQQSDEQEWPVIFSYTRKQAIDDGVLVDLTEWAKETGFVAPVACTRTVWNQWIVPPEGTADLGQSERGRAHDMLWMAYLAIRGAKGGQQVQFEMLFLNAKQAHEQVTLKLVAGPGDQGELVITIMLPDED